MRACLQRGAPFPSYSSDPRVNKFSARIKPFQSPCELTPAACGAVARSELSSSDFLLPGGKVALQSQCRYAARASDAMLAGDKTHRTRAFRHGRLRGARPISASILGTDRHDISRNLRGIIAHFLDSGLCRGSLSSTLATKRIGLAVIKPKLCSALVKRFIELQRTQAVGRHSDASSIASSACDTQYRFFVAPWHCVATWARLDRIACKSASINSVSIVSISDSGSTLPAT